MAKIWAEGEILTAADLNTELNPSVAPNVPFAVSAGVGSINVSGTSVTTTTIPLPPGRFNTAPLIFLVKQGSLDWVDVVDIRVTARTTSSFTMAAHPRASASATLSFAWFAIAMTPTGAAG